MKSITKIIIGLVGIAAIGLLTYYVVTKEKNIGLIEKPITNPEQDNVATAKVIQDTILGRIKEELSVDGEEFTLTEVEGVYTNSTNDKMIGNNRGCMEKDYPKITKKISQHCRRLLSKL